MKKAVFVDMLGMVPLQGDPLAGIAEAYYWYDIPDAETFARRCQGAEVVVWSWVNISREMLDRLTKVKMLCYLGVGPESQIDMRYAWSKGITICNTPHYGDEAVAEHGIALMLALARHVVKADKSMRQNKWQSFEGKGIRGTTMGVVGLGGLGSELATIGNGLGMKVICYTKNPSPERARKHKVKFVSLDELMSTSDYIQLAPVLNDETRGMIGEKQLRMMKKDAYLINVARGPVVDQAAVLKVLNEGRIAGYGADVFAKEPATDDPLTKLDNVVLTPHVAYDTPPAKIKMVNIAVDVTKAWLQGKPINVLKPA